MGVLFTPQAMTTDELAKRLAKGAKTRSGAFITEENALKFSVVFACVKVIAETCAQLPLPFYRRIAEGKQREPKHWLARLLNKPNPWQNGFQFREMMTGHVALRGNAYAFKNIIGSRIEELIPLSPAGMQVTSASDGTPQYLYTPKSGLQRQIPTERVFHLKGFSTDGYTGESPIALQREAIGLGVAAERFGAQFFGNGAKPNAVFKHPKGLSDQAYDRLKRELREDFTGEGALETMLLEEGLDWMKVGIDPKDAQTVELRQFQVEDVARAWRMPPHKIGHLLRATNNNIEQQGLEFYTDTMLPWFARWEWALWELLSPAEQELYFAEFLVEGLLRGDSKARSDYYKAALGDTQRPGWMTVDEVRARENMNLVGIDTFPPLITKAQPSGDTPNDPSQQA